MKPAIKDTRFSQLFVQIHSSLWFVPTLVVLAMVLLALGLVEFDRHAGDMLGRRWPRTFGVEAEGARSMLSAIASAMATVSGVAFSITVVALVLASNQYTSRVMRNFMRDRATQVVLGIFLGVYIYCLVVLRTVSGEAGAFVPTAAVFGALVMAVLASGAFIFFVHHISATIQASEMAQAITRDTLAAIDDLFPEQPDAGADATPAAHGTCWQPVPALQWGYIQTVALDRMLRLAVKHGTVIRMERQPGDFASADEPLLALAMPRPPERRLVDDLNRCFGIDAFRTIDQDPAFGLRQLVDMSLKALSPGINDTTTAVTCLDNIGVILQHCAGRDLAPRHLHEDGTLRVITRTRDAAHFVRLAFSQIVENAEGNTVVMLKVLATLDKVARMHATEAMRAALRHELEVIEEIALRGAKSAAANGAIVAALANTGRALGGPAADRDLVATTSPACPAPLTTP